MSNLPLPLVNVLLFQLGWFSCVLAAANQMPWLGTLAVVLIIVYHLSRSEQPEQELKLVMLALFIGFCWDSLLVWAHIVNYDTGQFYQHLAPHWIIAMWALFASTLNVSLRWLKGRLLITSLFGLVGGPLSYYAGFKLGAVNFNDTVTAMLALGFGWSLIMPGLMVLSDRFDGFNSENVRMGGCDA